MNMIVNNDITADTAAAQFELLFPSPVIFFDWPDSQTLNEALRDAVLKRRETTTGVVKTNRGGWQSDTNLQEWDDPATQQLVERMLKLAQEYVARQIGRRDPAFESGWKIRAWANVNEKGHFNRTHDHLGRYSFFSGVYYVNVGDIESGQVGGGRTRFEDWTHVAIDINQNTDTLRRDYLMMPKNGRMLLFPASLMHSVEIYGGDTQRITIAFNLYHPGFGVPRLEEFMQQSDWWWTNFRGLMIAKRKVPEKLYALTKIPGQLLARKVENPLSLNAWRRHVNAAIGHATALASEHFEAKRKV
ncbi:putative 2OG-Fe(II) oxygenase [Chitinivorax sp. B]|uniref:putative 2OG-Fe(II) oxygenase n=1 Tax=Chitinivorax sp. B TaxID=2502235 RepID=UPI001485997D|nr:putative 2OG-Fe(II) oxygenase [Chitinivorax sp. B]